MILLWISRECVWWSVRLIWVKEYPTKESKITDAFQNLKKKRWCLHAFNRLKESSGKIFQLQKKTIRFTWYKPRTWLFLSLSILQKILLKIFKNFRSLRFIIKPFLIAFYMLTSNVTRIRKFLAYFWKCVKYKEFYEPWDKSLF